MFDARFKKGGCWLFLGIGAAVAAILPFPSGAGAALAPAPKISVSPASVSFSAVKVGHSAFKTVTIKNTGTADLVVGPITITGTDETQFGQTNDCTIPLPNNGFCTVSVTFSPTIPYSKKSAALNIPSTDPKKLTATVKLSGKAPPPKISTSPSSVKLTAPTFDIPSAPATVTIKNTGVSDLNISSVTIEGSDNAFFHMTDTWHSVVPSGESCSVDITFTPNNTGTKSAILKILSDDPKKPEIDFKLTGSTSTSFKVSDMAGTWAGNLLAAGTSAPQWRRMTFTCDANGNFYGDVNGKFRVSADGKITVPGAGKMLCTMDAGKTVIACTDTPDPGLAQMGVFTRQAASYAPADLEGTWSGNTLGSGLSMNWWARYALDIGSAGIYTGTYYSSQNGSVSNTQGTFSIDPATGVITDPTNSNFLYMRCNMDAGKTVIACTSTPNVFGLTGRDIMVFTKNADSYAPADLVGSWAGSSLSTGAAAPMWERDAVTIKPDGTFTASIKYFKGASHTFHGAMAISSDGQVTIDTGEPNNYVGRMDKGKTVMVITNTEPDTGTTVINVITKKLK